MSYRLLHTAMAVCTLITAVQVSAQQKQTTAYAITSSEKGNFNWTDVKQIDFTTGTVTRSVFDSKQTNFTVYSARTGKELKPVTLNGVTVTTNATMPVASLSAACAFDQRHNRLYYAPLFVNQLRYVDLDGSTPRIYYFDNEPFLQVTNTTDEANHVTRMVIGADGDGYALSNDANHLMRFTTGRKPVITDLGALQDDVSNGDRSIHSKTLAWGGDMVADAAGNLYVISAFHHVFKVNIQSKVAAWVAEIKNLPATFTTNGAVVDNEGSLIVSSANTAEGYFKVDMRSWNASRINITGTVFNASDLANGNLAFPTEKPASPLMGGRNVVRNGNIALYPNPVATSMVNVNFNGKESGRYTIQLVDLNGKTILEKVAVVNGVQVVPVNFKQGLAKGPYMIKVLSNSKKTVFTDQLIID